MSPVKPINALAMIPISLIDVHASNPRGHLEDIDDLAASIRAVGLLQPLVVERAGPDRYRLRMGHRRLAACRAAGLNEALCMITAPASPTRFVAEALVENGQRRDLNGMEIAGALAQLMEAHHDQRTVARLIGRSEFYVSMYLSLLQLSLKQQDAVRSGFLSPTAAYDQIKRGRPTHGNKRVTGQTRAWHLVLGHPQADAAARTCDLAGHTLARRVGAIACGECWEQAIRDDERARITGQGAIA